MLKVRISSSVMGTKRGGNKSGREGEPEAPEPYVPATTELPELTFKAIGLGILLSAVLAGANAYLGLKVGMTVSASIPAAVLSMAILRLFRNSNILENNLVQTAASAGESLAAGVIFTLPALILLGYWNEFEFIPTTCIALFGGILGVLFTIPLRRALIIEAKLKFPEGVATAEVLKAGEKGAGGAGLIAVAGLAGAVMKLLHTGFGVVAGGTHVAFTAGRSVFGLGAELGPSLLAVGYIVGLNIAVLVFVGGLMSWAVGIPLYMAVVDESTLADVVGDTHGYEAALQVWSQQIRYLGVGAMATGGLYALVSLLKPVREGIRASIAAVRAAKSGAAGEIPRTERDTPIQLVLYGALALAVPVFGTFVYVIDRQALGVSQSLYLTTIGLGALFALLAGFLFSSVAGYMAGLVGSSNNPISGVTIATVLTVSLIFLGLLGSAIDFQVEADKALLAAAAAIIVGGVVCCAAAIGGDNMQDLKTGQLVGATPVKQQIMQLLGVAAAALVLAPVLTLLFQAYGLADVMPRDGMDPQAAMSAPQAGLMAAVALGAITQDLPWFLIAIGAGIAVLIIAVDRVLQANNSRFRAPVLAVAVGMYLPVELSVPIFVGGLIAFAASRTIRNTTPDHRATCGRRGLLLASGLITGEALVGIALAVPFALKQSNQVLRIATPEWFAAHRLGELIGIALFVAMAASLAFVASRPGKGTGA